MARIVAFVPDLFFAAKVRETLTSAGHEVVLASTQEQAMAESADIAIVDLHADGLDAAALVGALAGTPSIAFYSHVDEGAKHAGRLAGFDLVVPRSRMAAQMPQLIESLAGP